MHKLLWRSARWVMMGGTALVFLAILFGGSLRQGATVALGDIPLILMIGLLMLCIRVNTWLDQQRLEA